MKVPSFARLTRPKHSMPDFIREALEKNNLMARYRVRPAYQQNDYIAWITRAKQETTQQKRLNQMITELRKGTLYMNMSYKGK